MSKPRYRWWGFVRNMIRDYPALKEAWNDLHSQSMTPDYSGMPKGGSSGRTVESIALRQLPAAVKKLTKFSVTNVQSAGEAKHVFTHQIWQMQLYTMHVPETAEAPAGYRFIPVKEMAGLAIPTAVKAAVKAVRQHVESLSD